MNGTISVDDNQMSVSRLGFDDTVCQSVDSRIEQMVEMRNRVAQHFDDPSGIVVPVFIMCASCVCLFAGARLFRFTAAFAAGGFAFYVVYTFGRKAGERVSCEALMIMSSIIAAVAAVSAGCIYKAGLFFVGAAAMVFLVHLVFSTFPELHSMGDQPMLAGKSLVYWGMLLLSAMGGGLVLRWYDKSVLEVITACVGGAGIAYSLHAIATFAGAGVDEWVFMVIGLCAALVGTIVQRRLRLRGCKQREADTQRISRV